MQITTRQKKEKKVTKENHNLTSMERFQFLELPDGVNLKHPFLTTRIT